MEPRCTSGVVFKSPVDESPVQKRCQITPHGPDHHHWIEAVNDKGTQLVVEWDGMGVMNEPRSVYEVAQPPVATQTIPVVKSPMRQALDIMDDIAKEAGVSFNEPMDLPDYVVQTIIPPVDHADQRAKAEYMLRRMHAWAQLLVDNLPQKEPELIPYPNGHNHAGFMPCRKKCPMNKESNDA